MEGWTTSFLAAQRARHWALGTAFASLAMLVGCGGGSDGGESDQSALEASTALPQIRLESPAVNNGRVREAEYPCRPRGVWLPLQWGPVPPRTATLVLMTTHFKQSVVKNRSVSSLEAVSAIDALSPESDQLEVGQLPLGSAVTFYRRSRFCPPAESHGQFLFQLFALPSDYPGAGQFKGTKAVEALFDYALARGEMRVAYR